MPLNALVLWAF